MASGWAARMVSASASTITGRSVPSANQSAAAPAWFVPMPGPTAHACTFPAASALGEAISLPASAEVLVLQHFPRT